MHGTLSREWWDLMQGPSIDTHPFCAVCGDSGRIERHHMVLRSAGELWDGDTKLEKPTITLCGYGNALGCHGLAHHGKLHFKFDGEHHWYLITPTPVKHYKALDMEGWRRLEKPPVSWCCC